MFYLLVILKKKRLSQTCYSTCILLLFCWFLLLLLSSFVSRSREKFLLNDSINKINDSVTGIFCCGPASVKAVYEQKVDAQYDVPFVYAEVNADVRKMIVRGGKILSTSVDKRTVGSLISTKRPGSMKMQDITSEYKTEEGKRKSDKKRQQKYVLFQSGHTKY